MPNAAIGILQSVIGDEATFGGAPAIENTTQSLKSAWDFLSAYEPRLNSFCNALVDRIGLTVTEMITFRDPWAVFNKGRLANGATVQDIYVLMQKATPYFNSSKADNDELMKAEFGADPAKVYSAYYAVNSRIKYKVTVNREELATAFLSEVNLDAFIQNVINQIYAPAEIDDFIMKKYLIHNMIKNSKIRTVPITAVTNEATGKSAITKMKATYGKMKYISKANNIAGVPMNTPPERLYVIATEDFTAVTDVEVLASAFNMSKADYMGRRIGVDSFALNEYEVERLEHLLTGNDPSGDGSVTVAIGGDETYIHVTPDDTQLAGVAAILVDSNFFQVYTKLDVMRQNQLASTLDNNYFHHKWMIYAASPFAQAVAFSSYTG